MSYDNNLQVVLAKVVSDNPKAPDLRINTEINGVKHSAGLWPMTRKDGSVVKDKNGNTLYKGTLAVDDYQPGNEASRQPPPAEEFTDDIPF